MSRITCMHTVSHVFNLQTNETESLSMIVYFDSICSVEESPKKKQVGSLSFSAEKGLLYSIAAHQI